MTCAMRPARIVLPMDPTAAKTARDFLANMCCGRHDADTVDEAQLLVSELVGNAVRHGAPPIEVEVQCAGAESLLIRVRDAAAGSRPPAWPVSTTRAGAGSRSSICSAMPGASSRRSPARPSGFASASPVRPFGPASPTESPPERTKRGRPRRTGPFLSAFAPTSSAPGTYGSSACCSALGPGLTGEVLVARDPADELLAPRWSRSSRPRSRAVRVTTGIAGVDPRGVTRTSSSVRGASGAAAGVARRHR